MRSHDNLDLATVSTRIALRDFPRSRACDTLDKKEERSFSELRKFLFTCEIIFIIALQSLSLRSFLSPIGSRLVGRIIRGSNVSIVSFSLLSFVLLLFQPSRCRIRFEIPPTSVLISTQWRRDTSWHKRLFPSILFAFHGILWNCETTPFPARFIVASVWHRVRAPRRDVIISRPKFRDNGRVSDFRASAAQKSLIKLSSDRGWYLAIISLRGALRNLLGGTLVETAPRANKNIV